MEADIDIIDVAFDDLQTLDVEVGLTDRLSEQSKQVTITENGTYTVTPDDGKTLSRVTTQVSVLPLMDSLEATENGEYEPANPYVGFDKVSVAVVPVVKGSGRYPIDTNYTGTSDCIYDMSECIGTRRQWFNGAKVSGVMRIINVTKNITDISMAFWNCPNITAVVGLDTWDISACTNLEYLFCDCRKLTSLEGMEEWDTGKVTKFELMFRNVPIVTLDVSKWKTTNVTSIASMFQSCSSLQKITGLENWDTGKVTNMNGVFQSCESLQELNIGNWDVSKVTTMENMLYGLPLTTLDLNNWNTSSVTSMENLFFACDMESLNIGNWDVSNVKKVSQMFVYCYELAWLDLSKWDFSSLSASNDFIPRTTPCKTIIGDHTLAEVEAGTVVALSNMSKGGCYIKFCSDVMRYSSMLAVAKGCYDRKTAGLSNQTFYLSRTAYNNCRNDDDTIPDTATITERQNTLVSIITGKGYNIAYE